MVAESSGDSNKHHAQEMWFGHNAVNEFCAQGVRLKVHLRITRKSARKAMAKPQHSAALKIAIFDSPLLFNLNVPTTARTSMFSY